MEQILAFELNWVDGDLEEAGQITKDIECLIFIWGIRKMDWERIICLSKGINGLKILKNCIKKGKLEISFMILLTWVLDLV